MDEEFVASVVTRVDGYGGSGWRMRMAKKWEGELVPFRRSLAQLLKEVRQTQVRREEFGSMETVLVFEAVDPLAVVVLASQEEAVLTSRVEAPFPACVVEVSKVSLALEADPALVTAADPCRPFQAFRASVSKSHPKLRLA